MFLTQLFYDSLLTLAYPQVCAICFQSVEQRWCGVACASCWKATRVFNGSEMICWKCGRLAEAVYSPLESDEIRCRRCEEHSFTAARAIGLYEGALRESVLLLKREPYFPKVLEELVMTTAMRAPLNQATRVVPVPLHPKRMRARGFNQASVIAHALAKTLRLPLDEVSLMRVSSTEKYRAGLDSKGRQDSVAGAFTVRHARLIESESILLVDDVFTTGATVSSCAGALINAGARSVFVLTLARA